MRINLGDVARDRITGFTGVVIAETQWLHGCRRLCIQPQKLKDGKPIDDRTFDELQLDLVKAVNHKAIAINGGPRPDAARHPNASR